MEGFYVAFFKKRPPIQRAERWSPPQRRNLLFGVFLLLSFSFAPAVSKEKRINDYKSLVQKGKTPTCVVLTSPLAKYPSRAKGASIPSFGFAEIHPFVALSNGKEFRSLRRATADLGGSGKPLKRLKRNFQIGFATKSQLIRNL